MDTSNFMTDATNNLHPYAGTKFTCPRHSGEKFIRICMNINCEKPALLCGGCLLDDPEHCLSHKTDIKLNKEFIEFAENAYSNLKNRQFKPPDISNDLLEYLNESDKVNENLAKKFYAEAQKLDVEFEQIIKEFTMICTITRDDLKKRMKKNYEKLSENYKFVFEKIKNAYNILEQNELEVIYPTKEKIYSQLYNANSFVESEAIIKKIRYDIYDIAESSPKGKKHEMNKKVELKNQLVSLSKFVRDQIANYSGFYFENESEIIDSEKFQKISAEKMEELFKSVKSMLRLPDINPCTNLPRENIDKVFNIRDFEVSNEIITNPPPYLHFFKQNTQQLYLLSIASLTEKQEKATFKKMQLDIDFKIPYDHASICAQNGNIYLLGGHDYTNYFRDCFEYITSKGSLVRLNSMKRQRANHGICILQNSIYVIGGYDGTTFLRDCERYDFEQEKWDDVASLNNPCAFASACTFNDNYIYKFGGVDNKNSNYVGNIEKHDVDLNYWYVLNVAFGKINSPKADIILGESMESVQINRRQILVFGGKYKGRGLNQTFLLDINNQGEEVKGTNRILLPFEEFFRSPKATFVSGGFVNSVGYYMRRIIRFDGFKWTKCM